MNTNADSNSPKSKRKANRKARRAGKRSGHNRGRSKQDGPLTESRLVARFAVCGRCSHFLSAYRLSIKPDWLPGALSEAESGWLSMEWEKELNDLVGDAYGIRTDIASAYFEACCPECRRVFVYRSAETDDDTPASFRIHV